MSFSTGINSLSGIKINNVKLFIFILALLFSVDSKSEEEFYYNPYFLSDNPESVADLSSFEKGLEVPEGNYLVDIYLNDIFLKTQYINFIENKGQLSPCITKAELKSWNVNLNLITDEQNKDKNNVEQKNELDEHCQSLTSLISQATANFDVGSQKLNLTIPQVYLVNQSRGFIPPELWDDGIVAGFITYILNGSKTRNDGSPDTHFTHLNLQSGINLGPWRLRDNSIYSYDSINKSSWKHLNTYIERGINKLYSRLIIGDSYTQSEVFDSINFRGFQLSSDEVMLPDSQRGFAPIIRGVARTNAEVTIQQNGYVIYRNSFPPGPFVIDDLYSTSNSGDLEVTITESDGSTQTFTVPYSSVPLLQREGHTKYSVTVGSYRSGNDEQERPYFLQGSVIHGLPAGWTIYGGTQLSKNYQAASIGVGKNIGRFGALSFDITEARSILPDDSTHRGQSIRILYNKSINELGTRVQLAGYKYATSGFYTLAETTYKKMRGNYIQTEDGVVEVSGLPQSYYDLIYNKRQRIQLNITQKIGDQSTLYIIGTNQRYWNSKKQDNQLQIGLNTIIKGINLGLNYSLSKTSWNDSKDQMLAFNTSIPFSNFMRSDNDSIWQNASLSTNSSHNMKKRFNNTIGLNGTLLEDKNLSYNIQTGYSHEEESDSTGYASLSYNGSYMNSNIGYNYTDTSHQINYGMSGSILAHSGGITLSQPISQTAVLVKVPEVKNIKLENNSGITTDSNGYAVLPYVSEYKENRIALDTNSFSNNIEIDNAVKSVVPTRGAISAITFEPSVGIKAITTLTHKGKPVPFGAIVDSGNNTGIVADEGKVYLTGLSPSGQLKVNWGSKKEQQCLVNYTLPPQDPDKLYVEYSAECHPIKE